MQMQIGVFELILTVFCAFALPAAISAMPNPLHRSETETADENRTSSENGPEDGNGNKTVENIAVISPVPMPINPDVENSDWPVLTTDAFPASTSGGVVVQHEGMGFVLGDSCEQYCNANISNAFCNRNTRHCECEHTHPIALNSFACIAPVHLGEICNYGESCTYYEANAECAQVSPYYSKCACKESYILVGQKEAISQKCVPEGSLLTREAPAVFGVSIALIAFAGLTCLALRLFSKARFSEPEGHFANANLTPPPMMMTGVSTISGGSAPHSRRSSGRSSTSRQSIGSTPCSRHPSYSQLALPSRPSSRRPSAASVRSQVSVRSYRHERGGPHPAAGGHHEVLRATVSAPLTEASASPSRISIRVLEQKFGQHMVNVHSYPVRREKRASRESSRHSSQEIITEVIAEDIEKCELAA